MQAHITSYENDNGKLIYTLELKSDIWSGDRSAWLNRKAGKKAILKQLSKLIDRSYHEINRKSKIKEEFPRHGTYIS